MKRLHLCGLVMVVLAVPCKGTSIPSVSLRSLFAEAEVVAHVSIRAGDADGFEQAVYKAKVLDGLKGTSEGDTIYFGPHVSYGVGSEYILFLQSTGKRVDSVRKVEASHVASLAGAKAPLMTTMYSGYGALAIEYTCFEYPDCYHVVRLNPEQVLLPRRLHPHDCNSPCSNVLDALVGRDELLKVLRRYARFERTRGRD